jgi:hypothetical protein
MLSKVLFVPVNNGSGRQSRKEMKGTLYAAGFLNCKFTRLGIK